MSARAIHHVGLEVPRSGADAEVAFWALLGFAEVEPPAPLGERSRWVQRDGQQIHLLYAGAPSVPAAGHVAVVAPDWEAALARLRAAGHEAALRAAYWGRPPSPRTQVLTPAGHRVEVMAAAPA
jgi:catechol 2,3-dioxygenase-like lactoylglutathione lyase family enzyme